MKKLTLILLGALLCSQLALSPTLTQDANAADATQFEAGRIIDDLVFTNSDSMSPDDIQRFLNSKMTTCDTYGQKQSELGGGTRAQWAAARGYSTTFTCLKDYYENPTTGENNYGGKAVPPGSLSAAQIIHTYSKQFNINPQVIIVTLQKEKGMVTDEWPILKDMREAMGFGCPDNVAPGAPACDPAYRSFSTQIYQAARHFRGYMDRQYCNGTWCTPYVLGNNEIKWQANAPSCGTSIVNIQTLATSALYSYTPYRPNQAALNAGYGTGDACSAYGNRNFYLYFSDWFGSVKSDDSLKSHPDGTLISFNGSVYLIQGDALHHVINGAVFESNNFRWSDVKPATSGDKKLPVSWPLDFINQGILYTGDNSGVYTTVYENNQWKKQLVSYTSFNNLGYSWNRVRTVYKDQLPVNTSSTILTSSRHPDGTLIKNAQGVFLIDHGTRRYVSAPVFESHRWNWSDIVPETSEDQSLPQGANMLLRQGSVVSDGTNLFVIQLPASGPEIKRAIGPWECYANIFKYNMNEVIYMNSSSIPQSTGPNVTC